jgi:hypothetical protein
MLTKCCCLLFVFGPLLAAAQTDSARIVTVFFGLDDALPITVNSVCPGGFNQDGLIVSTSHPLDSTTLDAADIRVYLANGDSATPVCVTLAPADEHNELRTILTAGNLGNATLNPPVRVKIVGDLFTLASAATDFATCLPSVNLKGAEHDTVIPLTAGPTIAFAHRQDTTRLDLGVPDSTGIGAGCPLGTALVVQVMWVGGVVAHVGTLPDSLLNVFYTVWVDSLGTNVPRTPFALADLYDNDNFHDLCLATTEQPVMVSFEAGYVEDPNGDANPFTNLALTYCAAATNAVAAAATHTSGAWCTVAPNPVGAEAIVRVHSTGAVQAAWLWNTSGQVVAQAEIMGLQTDTEQRFTLQTDHLPNGLYTVVVQTANGVLSARMLK